MAASSLVPSAAKMSVGRVGDGRPEDVINVRTSRSGEIKVHLDREFNVYRLAIPHSWPKTPLPDGLDGLLVEAKWQAAGDADDINRTVSPNGARSQMAR